MSHPRKHRETKQPSRRARTIVTSSLGIAAILMLALAFLIIIGRAKQQASASSGPPPAAASPTSTPFVKHICGTQGEPACPPDDPGWFLVTSDSPAVVATAIGKSAYFLMMQSRYGYTSLDTPVLVRAYGPHTGIEYYDDDHWVVSVRNAAGREVGVFDFVYDNAHQHLRFSSFGVLGLQDPHAHQAFPYMPAPVAIAQLQNQRKLSMLAGTQPALIFFPIDPRWRDINSPVSLWKGGGDAPMDPMWHLVGSDGHDYFIGPDLKVHIQQDLPFAPEGLP